MRIPTIQKYIRYSNSCDLDKINLLSMTKVSGPLEL